MFRIRERIITSDYPTYCIAELSANHCGRLDHALDVIRAMNDSGADAVKLQTYTADTLKIKSDGEEFRVGDGTLWEGRTLYDLHEEAHTHPGTGNPNSSSWRENSGWIVFRRHLI